MGAQKLLSTHDAVAALKSDGYVVTQDHENLDGGDSAPAEMQVDEVQQIFSTPDVFAALKSDGYVITWGCEEVRSDDHEARSGKHDDPGLDHLRKGGSPHQPLKSSTDDIVHWHGRRMKRKDIDKMEDLQKRESYTAHRKMLCNRDLEGGRIYRGFNDTSIQF